MKTIDSGQRRNKNNNSTEIDKIAKDSKKIEECVPCKPITLDVEAFEKKNYNKKLKEKTGTVEVHGNRKHQNPRYRPTTGKIPILNFLPEKIKIKILLDL